MRILFRSELYAPTLGGVQSHVASLAQGLAHRGHQVQVHTTRQEPTSPRTEEEGGLRVVRTPGFGQSAPGLATGVIAGLPGAIAASRTSDILHTQAILAAPPLLLSSRLRGKPHVITVHTSRFLRWAQWSWARPLLKFYLNSARHIFVVSEEIEDVVQRLAPGCPLTRLVNAVDTRVFAPQKRPDNKIPRLLCPRRLVSKNGVRHLIAAMPAILAGCDVQLEIIGIGPEHDNLTTLCRELNMEQHITFSGGCPNHEMPSRLANADVVVIPSLVEATSIAALEAMACGVPVAASRVGGLPEIVNDSTGILFNSGDSKDLAERVLELLAAPNLKERGQAARDRVVDHWNLDRLVDIHENIYQEILKKV
jgi:glycosyltransferase involved in cell wall biosynthesis